MNLQAFAPVLPYKHSQGENLNGPRRQEQLSDQCKYLFNHFPQNVHFLRWPELGRHQAALAPVMNSSPALTQVGALHRSLTQKPVSLHTCPYRYA